MLNITGASQSLSPMRSVSNIDRVTTSEEEPTSVRGQYKQYCEGQKQPVQTVDDPRQFKYQHQMSGQQIYGHHLSAQAPEYVAHLRQQATGSPRESGSFSQQQAASASVTTNATNLEQPRCSSREHLIRWSSVDRANSTPSECLQVLPLEVRCGSDGHCETICNEQGHRVVLDGDAYTLLILDCSPQPPVDRSNVNCSACQCHTGCHCQSTELIVRHQTIPHEHSHQHHDNHSQRHLSIEHRPITSVASSRGESELNQQRQQQQQANEQQQQQQRHNYHNRDITWHQQEQQQQQWQIEQQRQSLSRNSDQEREYRRQVQEQEQFPQHQRHNSKSPQQPQVTTTTTTTTTQQVQHLQVAQKPESYQDPYNQEIDKNKVSHLHQQAQHQYQQYDFLDPMDEIGKQERQVPSRSTEISSSSQEADRSDGFKGGRLSKGGTRLVKKWDWNRAQFVEVEVLESEIPKPQPIGSTSRQPRPSSTDIWHQDYLISQPSSSYGTTAQQQSSQQQQQQPDPAWLAYVPRIPDEDSVKADPLYRDLMLELKRLEEGVSAVPEQVNVEPETLQKPIFGQRITPESVEVKEYENAEFICRLIPISDPSMKVEWSVNGKPLQDSSRITNEYEFGVVRLHIKRCEAEDSGVYQCKASNSLGEAIATATLRVHAKGNIQCETLNPAGLEQIRQLENPKQVDRVEEQQVEQPPKFLSHIVDYVEKNEGDSVHFECCLSPVDDPNLKTEWFFNGRPLVTGSRFHTIDDFGFIVLDIDWLFPRDTGEYVCRASNKYGTDITRTVLRVKPGKNIELESQLDNPMLIDKLRQLEFPDVSQEVVVEEPNKPAHFVQHLKSAGNKSQFVEGDNVHFEARVGPATDGTLTVEWFHNDKPLMDGHRFKPSFDFGHIQLDILYVYHEDSGIYKCVARNASGTDVSQYEIGVAGKPSLIYQSQLPKEMEGGVQKITDMEAMWNRAPDPEEEAPPADRMAPQFVLKPKPYTAFEGSCARFCCRIVANPKARLTWVLNGQTVVSGSRHKLTYDGMYHLTIPKCQLSDAGKLEVYAKNPLGECFAYTELKVKRKVDDYRGVLKNSPNPWYDEQTLKMYRRQRQSQDLTDDDDLSTFQSTHRLYIATEQQSNSPVPHQVIGYMEPGTPDVNILARMQSPLIEPGDLHPVVIEQQVVMAPAPSTIQRAFKVKDSIKAPEKSFQLDDSVQKRQISLQRKNNDDSSEFAQDLTNQQHDNNSQILDTNQLKKQEKQQQQQQQHQRKQDQNAQLLRQDQKHVYGLDLSRYSSDAFNRDHGQQQQQQRDSLAQRQRYNESESLRQQLQYDPRLPPPSPESVVHGKEVHSHIHKQTQLERRANKEIVREIIEKEIFEQEHKGYTKDNARASSTERGLTPDGNRFGQQQVLINEHSIAPVFTQKIHPCQAYDGDEGKFECIFRGDPMPTITWFCGDKVIKPTNLYNIQTDLVNRRSTLFIKRVGLSNSDAIYSVKAENVAGSAKSTANLVVEPHPLPGFTTIIGVGKQYGSSTGSTMYSSSGGQSSLATTSGEFGSGGNLDYSSQSESSSSQKVIKSVRKRKISAEEMAKLIRASPDGLVAPTFLYTIHDVTCKLSELARFDARLVGSHPIEVRWVKDGERVRADKGHKMVLEGDQYTLLILECGQADVGVYECVASNRIGEARCEARLTLSSNTVAYISGPSCSSSIEVRSSSVASSAGGKQTPEPFPQASSSLKARTITSESSYSSSTSGRQEQEGQRQHFGLNKQHHYTPLLNPYHNQPNQQMNQVQEMPKLIKRLENQQVREGKSVTLRCQISSFPPAEVNWYKQGDKLIKPSKYFRIFKDNDETYCLKILETFPEDQGEYKCVARAPNGQSQVETKAHITVIPNSPR